MKKQLRRLTIVGGYRGGARRRHVARRVGQAHEHRSRQGGRNAQRVGWEQSFGFNDGFDPTGEYLGDAFGI